MPEACPVVLLHGWGGTFEKTWTANGWPEALAEVGRTVVAIDLPGHARPESDDPAFYSDLAAMLQDRLPPGRLDGIAYSLGGKLALAIAAQTPGRFRRLAIGGVGDNLFAPEPSAEHVANALVRGIDADTPAAVAALVRYATAGKNDPGALAAVLRRPPNPRLAEQDLARIEDVLLVNGDCDAIATPDQRLRDALPDVHCVRLGGVDHLTLPASSAFRTLALDHVIYGYSTDQEPS